MRASVFERAGAPLSIVNLPDPAPASSDLIIKVAYSGVCGTDLHLTQAGLETPLQPGIILGHEFAGEVVEVGRSASGWKVGDRATAMPFRPCPACGVLCNNGLDIICPQVAYVGIGAPGGNAQYVAIGAAQARRLPDAVDIKIGALVEPLGIGLHAVRKAGPLIGANVLVIGGGPVGLTAAMFARLAGASKVVVSEPQAPRRQRAMALGATAALDPRDGDVGEAFADLTGGAPTVVFECVGTPGMIAEAIRVAPLFGRVLVVGACMELDRFHPMIPLAKELSLQFVMGSDRDDFQFVIDCLEQGRIQPEAMITDVVGFDAFPGAFDRLRSSPDSCKLLLKPN